jgi:hypothetical protein
MKTQYDGNQDTVNRDLLTLEQPPTARPLALEAKIPDEDILAAPQKIPPWQNPSQLEYPAFLLNFPF